jgi:hypothetical protein
MSLFNRFLIHIYKNSYENSDRALKQHTKAVRWYLNKLNSSELKFCHTWQYVHENFFKYYLTDPFPYSHINYLHDNDLKSRLKYYVLENMSLQYYGFFIKSLNLKYLDIFKLIVIIPILKRWIKRYKLNKYYEINKYILPDVTQYIIMPYLNDEDKTIIISEIINVCWECYMKRYCIAPCFDYDHYIKYFKKTEDPYISVGQYCTKNELEIKKNRNRQTDFEFLDHKISKICRMCNQSTGWEKRKHYRLHVLYNEDENKYVCCVSPSTY